jgi:hypothetical protein
MLSRALIGRAAIGGLHPLDGAADATGQRLGKIDGAFGLAIRHGL